ncbi:EamA family transporter, partial [Frankia sp. EI5c]|uniref:EamA family transporter n=1 Tax=Frankia sp. EI5c TaxID=683316 RepID=UPI0037BECE95
ATSRFAPLLPGPWFNLGQLGVVAVLASLATAVSGFGELTWPGLLAAGYTGLAQAVGLSLQVSAQRRLDGGQAVMILTTIPVMTTVAAWLIVGDPLTAAVAAGGVLIIAGVAVSECWGRLPPVSLRMPPRHPRSSVPVFPLSQPNNGPVAPGALDAPVALAGEE